MAERHNDILDERQHDIITKLKFLSKIQAGEKINVEGLRLEKDGVMLVLKRRYWSVDNRQKTEEFVREVIGGGIEELCRLGRGGSAGERSICETLGVEVRGALNGIRSLKRTYSDDTYFCCGIDTYIELIEARLLDYDDSDITPHSDNTPHSGNTPHSDITPREKQPKKSGK